MNCDLKTFMAYANEFAYTVEAAQAASFRQYHEALTAYVARRLAQDRGQDTRDCPQGACSRHEPFQADLVALEATAGEIQG